MVRTGELTIPRPAQTKVQNLAYRREGFVLMVRTGELTIPRPAQTAGENNERIHEEM